MTGPAAHRFRGLTYCGHRQESIELICELEDKIEESTIELHYSQNGLTPNIYNHKVIVSQVAVIATSFGHFRLSRHRMR